MPPVCQARSDYPGPMSIYPEPGKWGAAWSSLIDIAGKVRKLIALAAYGIAE